MGTSVHCPHCKLPELVHMAWNSVCLACGKISNETPPEQRVEFAPVVDKPVRDGHSLISNASPLAATAPALDTTGAEVADDPVVVPSQPETVPPPPAEAPTEAPPSEGV